MIEFIEKNPEKKRFFQLLNSSDEGMWSDDGLSSDEGGWSDDGWWSDEGGWSDHVLLAGQVRFLFFLFKFHR